MELSGRPRPTRTAWLLLATRFTRSIWQGALVVDFALYLRALGWGAVAISMVLAGALAAGALLTMVLGPLSDRFGRRRFLLVYDALQGAAALTAFVTASPAPLAIAAVIGGFGRGGNGSAGPFAPVEQAWLAQCVPVDERGHFYSLNSACGFIGMGAGAVIAALPGWFAGVNPPPDAYHPLFAMTALLSLVAFLLVLAGEDSEGAPPPPTAIEEEAEERRRENRLLGRLVFANFLNGAGIGLVGPLIAYWFALRFDRGPGAIGPMMAASFILAAAASLGTGWLSRRIGIVRAVVTVRAAGLAMLVALPFAPSFGLAAVLYVGRGVFNQGTSGARSALNIGIVRPSRRGLSASSANVALQIPRAVGPVAAGICFDAGLFTAPFLIAALLQAGYLWVYDRSFRNVELR